MMPGKPMADAKISHWLKMIKEAQIKGNKLFEQGISKTSLNDISALKVKNESGHLHVTPPI